MESENKSLVGREFNNNENSDLQSEDGLAVAEEGEGVPLSFAGSVASGFFSSYKNSQH